MAFDNVARQLGKPPCLYGALVVIRHRSKRPRAIVLGSVCDGLFSICRAQRLLAAIQNTTAIAS